MYAPLPQKHPLTPYQAPNPRKAHNSQNSQNSLLYRHHLPLPAHQIPHHPHQHPSRPHNHKHHRRGLEQQQHKLVKHGILESLPALTEQQRRSQPPQRLYQNGAEDVSDCARHSRKQVDERREKLQEEEAKRGAWLCAEGDVDAVAAGWGRAGELVVEHCCG